MLRAIVAVLAFALICVVVRKFSRRSGQTRVNVRSKLGLVVTFISLALWVPTTTTIAFATPSFTTIIMMLVVAIVLAVILFLFLGPLGIAGWFGATAAGLPQYLLLFFFQTLISATIGSTVRVVTVGLVPPIIVWGVAFVGFALIFLGNHRRRLKFLVISDDS